MSESSVIYTDSLGDVLQVYARPDAVSSIGVKSKRTGFTVMVSVKDEDIEKVLSDMANAFGYHLIKHQPVTDSAGIDMLYIVSVQFGDDSEYMNICSNGGKLSAMEMAVEMFRRQYNLPVDTIVECKTLYETSDPVKASDFYEELTE